MPPEPTAPGTESAAAAAEKSGPASPPPVAPAEAEEIRSEAAATARTEETQDPAETAAGAGDPPTAAAPSSADRTTAAPEGRAEGVALATGVAAKPETKTLTAADWGRPRTPVLAGAVFVGAALVAIPVLLMGSANDDKPRNTGAAPVAGSAGDGPRPGIGTGGPGRLRGGEAHRVPDGTEEDHLAEGRSHPRGLRARGRQPAPRTNAPAEKPKAPPKPKPKAAPTPNWGTQTVSATSSIGVGQSWATNRIRMTMQQDGNLVVHNEQNKPIWAAMTFGQNHRAIFQPDGNLVIHNGDDRAIWASKTHDFGGAHMVLRPDAKVVIVHNGRVVWST